MPRGLNPAAPQSRNFCNAVLDPKQAYHNAFLTARRLARGRARWRRAGPLAGRRVVGRTHFRYSQYINRLHGRSGHLWQGRFHSTALDREHFWWALRYVERNPVRARVVRRAWRYPWSSAAAHVGETRSDDLIDLRAWRRRSARLDWRALLCGLMGLNGDSHPV